MSGDLINPLTPRHYDTDEIYATFKSFRTFRDKEPRPGQIEAIEFAVNSPKSVVVIRGDVGCGKCIKNNSLIYTSNGPQRIDTITNSYSNDMCMMWSYNNKYTQEKYHGTYIAEECPTIRIQTDCGYNIEGTPEHKIIVIHDGEFIWRELHDIKHGDYIPVSVKELDHEPVKIKLQDYNNVEAGINGRFEYKKSNIDYNDNDFAYFLGRFIADGYWSNGQIKITSMNNTDDDFLHKFSDKININISKQTKQNCKAHDYCFSSVDLCYKLKQLGLNKLSINKEIPSQIFTASKEFKLHFLAGMFDGDSHYSANNIKYYTSSKSMAYQLQQLLLSIGVVSYVRYKKAKLNGEYFDSYRIVISNDFLHKFDLPLKSPIKKDMYNNLLNKKRNSNLNIVPTMNDIIKLWYKNFVVKSKGKSNVRKFLNDKCNIHPSTIKSYYNKRRQNPTVSSFRKLINIFNIDNPLYKSIANGDFFFDKVELIEKSCADVCDIEIPSTHSYIANGFISHNSAIGMTLCRLIYNSLYIVNSKSLQNQITQEFSEAKSLFGRSNYTCNYDIDRTADMCPKRKPWLKEDVKLGCPLYDQCEYRRQKAIVAEHPLRIINYSYALSEWNYTKRSTFSGKDIVVCDEGDTLAESVLMNFIRIEITGFMLSKFNIYPPKFKTSGAKEGVASWIDWAQITRRKVSTSKRNLPEDAEKRDIEMHEKLLHKLNDFIEFVDESWIYDIQSTQHGKKWVFSPIWVTPEMTDKYLRRHGHKFVLMSATFPALPALSTMLGIPVSEMDFHEMPAVFKPENKPIYVRPIAEINAKNFQTEFPKIVDEIARIIDAHPTHKGLIHTSSYEYVNMIMDKIKNDRLITHNTKDRIEKLNLLKESDRPLVLVSPSMERGVSLDDDYARFIILSKASFPNLGDKQVSTRRYSSQAGLFWYLATTAQIIEQQCGRAVRNEMDWCHIYLLDKNIKSLITKHPRMFNASFRNSLVWGSEMKEIGGSE